MPRPLSPPALRPLSSQSIPSETPSAPDSSSIPDEAPEIRCLDDDDQESDADKPTAKNDPPSQEIPEEAAEVVQLDEPAAAELAPEEVVDVDACQDEPASAEPAASGAEAEDAVPSSWQVVLLSSCIDVAPSRDLHVVSPFLFVSFPPKGKASMASPVTPGNPRSTAAPKPPLVPCTGLSEEEPEEPSRLSRRRNLVRRAAVRAVRKASSVVQVDGDLIVVDDDEEEEPFVRKGRKRSSRQSPPEMEKKVLHPFFATTAVSVKEARDRPKRPRIVSPPSDAWAYSGSTVHVNYAIPLLPWTATPGLRLFADERDRESKPTGAAAPMFEYYSSSSLQMRDTAGREDERPARRKVIEVENASSEMWAEKYKEDRRVDVISAAATKDLVDWLIPWYADNNGRDATDNGSSDDESMCSSICEPDPCDKERIAIISGPVGCGKSTVVANAARQLGLTILEINASTCRTGKRVRDIIGEALRTHRVASNKFRKPATNGRRGTFRGKHSEDDSCGFGSSSAKTLILFEEVDELQDDEKGFWPSLQELAASDDCRRPIICTANSFSVHMKQLFAVPKEPIDADFERLLINTKEDHILNPMTYKHISFPERSERQTTAVLKRVLTSEKVKLPPDAIEYLALTCRKDTRRAVNLLHLLGLPGLHNLTGSEDLPDSGMIERAVADCGRSKATEFGIHTLMIGGDVNPAIFHVGSDGFEGKFFQTEKFSAIHEEEQEQNTSALDAWCTSLDTMSYADTMLSSAESETRKRCGESLEFFDELCLDVDLQTSTGIAEELGLQALGYSRNYLCFGGKTRSLAILAKDMKATTLAPDAFVLHECPNPRRPILSEYIPILRTMACEEKSSISNSNGSNGKAQERVVRRTRASMKKGGFCALDLNISTVSELKRTALRPQR